MTKRENDMLLLSIQHLEKEKNMSERIRANPFITIFPFRIFSRFMRQLNLALKIKKFVKNNSKKVTYLILCFIIALSLLLYKILCICY